MSLTITIVGSRVAPRSVCQEFASFIQKHPEFVYRSGGADGIDKTVDVYAVHKEVFLPWPGFNNNRSQLYLEALDPYLVDIASEMASKIHPKFFDLNDGVKKLHTRNMFQISGRELCIDTASDLVICWTPDGAETTNSTSKDTGGTRTAIVAANHYGVPVLNLNSPFTTWKMVEQKIEEILRGKL